MIVFEWSFVHIFSPENWKIDLQFFFKQQWDLEFYLFLQLLEIYKVFEINTSKEYNQPLLTIFNGYWCIIITPMVCLSISLHILPQYVL